LDDLYDQGIYDERYTLYAARLELLSGRLEQAEALYSASQQTYQKLRNDEFPADELALFPAASTGTEAEANEHPAAHTIRDDALYRYLEMEGKSPADYGVARLDLSDHAALLDGVRRGVEDSALERGKTAGALARQQALVQEHIASELRSMREVDPLLDELDSYVNLILETNEMFESYTREQEIDRRELRKIIR